MADNSVVRYSDEDLAFFKDLIDSKLEKARDHLGQLQEQVLEITENTSDEHGGDWVDDSSINNDVEMLNNMAIRQRKHIQDLENALVRIRNKTYGICTVTGELIDKKRLIAVPTTTKSLAAKTQAATPSRPVRKEQQKSGQEKPKRKKNSPKDKVIISKVVRPAKPKDEHASPIADEDDVEESDDFDTNPNGLFDDSDLHFSDLGDDELDNYTEEDDITSQSDEDDEEDRS